MWPGPFATSLCGHELGSPEDSISSAIPLSSVIHCMLPREKDMLNLNADLDPEGGDCGESFLQDGSEPHSVSVTA